MQTVQGNMLQSLRNVEVFLEQNANRLDGVVQSDVRQRLTDAVAALQGHVSAQSDGTFGAKGATQKHQALRRALVRDHMLPIARIAAADLPDTPEVQPLKMPKGGPSVQRLAAAAYGMAETAARFSDVFTRATLPPDFGARLTAAADQMILSIGERTKSRLVRRRATEGLRTSLAAGRKIVGVLDALLRSKLQDDVNLLAAWESAKRVQQVGAGRPSAATTIPTVPVTPTAPTAPTSTT
jgi:hypothetical protein